MRWIKGGKEKESKGRRKGREERREERKEG